MFKDFTLKKGLRLLTQVLSVSLLSYAFIGGLTGTIAYQNATNGQTSRNIFYHVPMWFAMMLLLVISVIYSIMYLNSLDIKRDIQSRIAAKVAVVFGLLGLFTGIVWSRVTWGALMPDTDPAVWWHWDPKQTGALLLVLIYMGYFVLRRSFDEPVRRAKVAAVFNVFAAATIYPLLYLIPKKLGGQHPNTGNDESSIGTMGGGYGPYFWAGVVGFILLSIWIMDVRIRLAKVEHEINELEAI